jgi:hypothetical protein
VKDFFFFFKGVRQGGDSHGELLFWEHVVFLFLSCCVVTAAVFFFTGVMDR